VTFNLINNVDISGKKTKPRGGFEVEVPFEQECAKCECVSFGTN